MHKTGNSTPERSEGPRRGRGAQPPDFWLILAPPPKENGALRLDFVVIYLHSKATILYVKMRKIWFSWLSCPPTDLGRIWAVKGHMRAGSGPRWLGVAKATQQRPGRAFGAKRPVGPLARSAEKEI